MAGLFLNENVAQGVPNGPGAFQAGINNVDAGTYIEQGVTIPWVSDPEFSWLDYLCWLEWELDSGIVVHRTLPQSAQQYDSLGVGNVYDKNLRKTTDGVNTTSVGRFTGIVQRMATSVYRVCLKGWARRAGYQIPIPRLLTVSGVPAIPDDDKPQQAVNMILANNTGIPVYFARWALWYTLAVPPTQNQDPPDNLAEHIGPVPTSQLLDAMPMPQTYPDQNAVPAGPNLPPLPTLVPRT